MAIHFGHFPTEIIEQIFEEVIEEEPRLNISTGTSDLPDVQERRHYQCRRLKFVAIPIVLVCHHWKTIVDQHDQFWRLDLTMSFFQNTPRNIKQYDELLSHSHNCDVYLILDLEIDTLPESHNWERPTDIFTRFSKRFASVEVRFATSFRWPQELQELRELFSLSFHRLRSVHFSLFYGEEGYVERFAYKTANINLPEDLTLNLGHLSRLQSVTGPYPYNLYQALILPNFISTFSLSADFETQSQWEKLHECLQELRSLQEMTLAISNLSMPPTSVFQTGFIPRTVSRFGLRAPKPIVAALLASEIGNLVDFDLRITGLGEAEPLQDKPFTKLHSLRTLKLAYPHFDLFVLRVLKECLSETSQCSEMSLKAFAMQSAAYTIHSELELSAVEGMCIECNSPGDGSGNILSVLRLPNLRTLELIDRRFQSIDSTLAISGFVNLPSLVSLCIKLSCPKDMEDLVRNVHMPSLEYFVQHHRNISTACFPLLIQNSPLHISIPAREIEIAIQPSRLNLKVGETLLMTFPEARSIIFSFYLTLDTSQVDNQITRMIAALHSKKRIMPQLEEICLRALDACHRARPIDLKACKNELRKVGGWREAVGMPKLICRFEYKGDAIWTTEDD